MRLIALDIDASLVNRLLHQSRAGHSGRHDVHPYPSVGLLDRKNLGHRNDGGFCGEVSEPHRERLARVG
jgi:hypothetical protein